MINTRELYNLTFKYWVYSNACTTCIVPEGDITCGAEKCRWPITVYTGFLVHGTAKYSKTADSHPGPFYLLCQIRDPRGPKAASVKGEACKANFLSVAHPTPP